MARPDRLAAPDVAPSGDRVRALDGLRGAAIVWAVSTHLMETFRPVSTFDRVSFIVAKAGWVALETFFALSGYLITSILWDTRGSRHYLLTFYARRLVRIVPVYYGFLLGLIFWITQIDALDAGESRALLRVQAWYWSFLVNWLVYWKDRWLIAPYNTAHFWSLAVEEQFYFAWPLCVMRLSRERLLKVAVAAFVFSVALRVGLVRGGADGLRVYVCTPARLDSLALGAVVALIGKGPTGFSALRRWILPAGLVSLAVLLAIVFYKGELIASDPLVQIVGFAVIAVGSSALIAGCASLPDSRVARVFDRPSLRRFGRYSYVMYVVHYPLVFALKRVGFTIPHLTEMVGSLHLAAVLYLVTLMTFTVGIAALSWELVEKWLNKRKDAWFPVEMQEP
jgi:peptidoglycan/LPS O-acetylase OafA/YrhL